MIKAKLNIENEKLHNEQKKLYKISNTLYKETIIITILLIIFTCLIAISDLTTGGEWSDFSTLLVLFALFYLSIPLLLFYLGLKNYKKYLITNNAKILNKVKILDIISLIINILYVLLLFINNLFDSIFNIFLVIIYVLLLIVPITIQLLLYVNKK